MKILIIDGHPYEKGLASRLAKAYQEGARKGKHEVRFVQLRDLDFDPILRFGYRKRMVVERDLQKVQRNMIWSQHIVITTPIWWMNLPALLKGFIDRTFLPKFAYSYAGRKFIPKGLLRGRSMRMIYTQGSPRWVTTLVLFDVHWLIMKYGIFKFVGFGPVKRKVIGKADKISKQQKRKKIKKIYIMGLEGK